MAPSAEDKSHPVNSPLAPETVLQGRYRIVRQLGKGGMGAVYEAVDQRLGITVALKETLSSEAASRKQFEHEARLLAGMQHPALPRVSDHFAEGDRAFLVMQFIAGVDLAKIIAQQPGPFPRDQVIVWADQLLDALMYLHTRDRQVIHRDIKPHNLKLTSTGQIALLDFGLARAQPADPATTSSQTFFGYTKQYAPLEQIQDHRTDPRSDIYALGATLYHLLTGVKPPDALIRAGASINGDPDPLQPANKLHPAVGSEISSILFKAMAQKPEDRFASASEFREALRCVGRERRAEVPPAAQSTSPNVEARKAADNSGELQVAMVVSARRFGPGVITLVLVMLLTLVGALYSAREWLKSSSAAEAAGPRQTMPAKKSEKPISERPKTIDNSGATAPKTINSGDKQAGREASVIVDPSKPGAARKRQALNAAPHKSNRRIDAPSIRLPHPPLPDNLSAPAAEAPVKTYRSAW